MQATVFEIALASVQSIGSVQAKLLIEKYGSAEAIFRSSTSTLEKTEGIGPVRAKAIRSFSDFARIEKELKYLERNRIRALFYTHADYPGRLRHCYDPPILLYYRGNSDLNSPRVIGIIGTRHYTPYGRMLTETLIRALQPHNPLIVSGLAYGIDAIAHHTALSCGLATLGVLAHGLDTVYPSSHRSLAARMVENGGVLTEFRAGVKPDKFNFPSRNRIVAGMCDALVVIETGEKGGSIITAELANSYNRDVFAFPGRIGDERSAGCNRLIHQNKAALIRSAQDFLDAVGWASPEASQSRPQPTLFEALTADEEKIMKIIAGRDYVHIDEISVSSGLSATQTSAALLKLELSGRVKSLPGKAFRAG